MDRRPGALPLFAGVTLLLLPLVLGAVAQAEETRLDGKLRTGSEVVIPQDETVPGNVYLAGGNVRVEGDVEGDLVAAGGRVHVTGNVDGDVLVAGGDVSLSGTVLGSARVAAGQAALTGPIDGDLALAAGRARIETTAEIGQDLLFSSGQLRMDGTVAGNVVGRAGEYSEQGSVAGARDVEIAPEAEPPTAGDRILGVLGRYVTLLVVGAVLLWLAPRVMRRGDTSLRREPLLAAGVGALAFLGAAAAVFALLVVAGLLAALLGLLGLGGLSAAVILAAVLAAAALVFTLVVLSAFAAPVLVGVWLGRFGVSDDGTWLRAFGALALGALAIVILRAVPILGGLVTLVVVLLGLGALVLHAFRRVRLRLRPPPQVPAPPTMPAVGAAP